MLENPLFFFQKLAALQKQQSAKYDNLVKQVSLVTEEFSFPIYYIAMLPFFHFCGISAIKKNHRSLDLWLRFIELKLLHVFRDGNTSS